MDSKVLQRLEVLRKVNANSAWLNDDLYRLMYQGDLYIVAYEKIKSSPGNMTPGSDETTLDGFSMSTVENIIREMRDESFVFSRARRVRIPKPNGGTRPLGVATPRDKVVQEVMRLILETIYDSSHGPSFLESSHGFRPGRGTHTALRDVRTGWQAVAWIIEGDIKGCFDNIDHDVLIDVLRKRIRDERFLNLIRKALKAGYLEFQTPVNSAIGTPQGSIISPILANIYLHELDMFVEGEIKPRFERVGTFRLSRDYRVLSRRTQQLSRQIDLAEGDRRRQLVAELRKVRVQITRTPTSSTGGDIIRIKYIRYADDWMIGVSGSRDTAELIREKVGDFLLEKLRLTLSPEKTHIRHAKTEEALFLGTRITVGTTEPRVVRMRRNGKYLLMRQAGWQPRLSAPVSKIVKRLADRGFCDAEGKPKHRADWGVLDDDQIIEMFSSVNRGYLGYYSFAANYSALTRIQYILKYSLARTLAQRHRTSVAKVFTKYGDPPKVTRMSGDGKPNTVSFFQERNWTADTLRFRSGEPSPPGGVFERTARLRTRSKLGMHCCVCGKTEQVEMHHIRHVRKMGHRTVGFARLMAIINRKQIPVCRQCHGDIHHGKYDGVGLQALYDPELAKA